MEEKTRKKRVGNTTNSPRDATVIQACNKAYSKQVEAYKAFAAARRKSRKWTQEQVGALYERLCAYVDECNRKGKPLTVAGTILALGINREAWRKAQLGELDYMLEEYIDTNNVSEDDITYVDGLPWYYPDSTKGTESPILLIPYSALRQKADLMIQEQLETNCYTNRGNPAGSIFGLKAQFDWREEQSPQHLVQQLVVADLDQAKKALEMLK